MTRRKATIAALLGVLEANHVYGENTKDGPLFAFAIDPEKVGYTDVFMTLTYGERTVKITVRELMDALDPNAAVAARNEVLSNTGSS